jgi:UDP-glucose:(heptosyl)LPS alpha-1,3-glucosyltransferase
VEQKIRFATAVPDFSKRKGGAERYLVDLCTRMVDHGFEVHVYAEHWDEETPGIHHHRVKTLSFPKSFRLLSFALRATKEMTRGNYDVTLGVGNTLRADVLQPHGGVHWAWFWRSLKAYDQPVLWTIKFLGRVLSPKQWIGGWIEDAPYKGKSYSKIIAISDMVKQDIIRWYGVSEDRIVVVYNGVDIERFHPRNGQYREEIRRRHNVGSELLILFVSNNFRMKGLDYLINALARMKREGHPAFKLLVLGRDQKEPYLRLANRRGISEEIVFVGPTDEPEKYYGAADVLVHPAFYDSFSLVVLEAMASGLPVITTPTTGASGILSHRGDGFIVENMRDLEELEAAITYFSNESVRLRASDLGRIKAERYSDQVNFNRISRVFKDTVNACLPKDDRQGDRVN